MVVIINLKNTLELVYTWNSHLNIVFIIL